VLQDFLEQGAIDFCQDTWICQETTTLTDTDGVFTATVPSGRLALGVLRMASNGVVLWSAWPQAADNQFGNIDPATLTMSQPLAFTISEDTVQISMVPTATLSQSITVTLATCPVQGADDVPSELLVRWNDAVMARALEKLLAVPNQVFTNGNLAGMFAGMYTKERTAARIELNRGLARNGARMSGPRFAGR
jgi:hypothetical protein